MAGIGFELRKLYEGKNPFLKVAAYQCASIVCSGPLLFSMFMLTAILFLTNAGFSSLPERNLLICLLTYSMIASLLVSAPFMLVINRYVADMIYEKRHARILPSFFGYSTLLMVLGGILYGIYLSCCGISLELRVLSLILFLELTVVWAEIPFLTAIRNYKGILLGFICSFILGTSLGAFLVIWGLPPVQSMIFGIVIGYGVMLTWYLVLLLRAFPQGEGSSFAFLRWLDRYPALSLIGILQVMGLFGHQALMWFSPLSEQVAPLLYWAPHYDVPTFLAFLTTLVTTISFTMTVEVRFYPKYRAYFDHLNKKGTKSDIDLAQKDMMHTLSRELYSTALKQCLVTALCIVLSSTLLPLLNLGLTSDMIAIFQVLCIGYAFFAIGNMIMLIQLYFSGFRQAVISMILFACGSIAGTLCAIFLGVLWYGYGFLLGAGFYCFSSWFLLERYMRNVGFRILSAQPIGKRLETGALFKLYETLQRRRKRGDGL